MHGFHLADTVYPVQAWDLDWAPAMTVTLPFTDFIMELWDSVEGGEKRKLLWEMKKEEAPKEWMTESLHSVRVCDHQRSGSRRKQADACVMGFLALIVYKDQCTVDKGCKGDGQQKTVYW